MKKYIYSDLFEENFCLGFGNSRTSRRYPVAENEVFSIYKSKIYKTNSEESGNETGSCITFFSSDIIELSNKDFDSLTVAVARELRNLMLSKVSPLDSVMVVGLGNPYVTADSLGAKTVERLSLPLGSKEKPHVFAFSAGVASMTGIETAEHIRALCLACRPDLIIAVDSLAARSRKRLCSAVQISDAGITPGSFADRRRLPINEETAGVPVISLGIPTVVSAATLICDALTSAGIESLQGDLKDALEEERGFFVTSGYCDMQIKCASMMLSSAIELACSKNI